MPPPARKAQDSAEDFAPEFGQLEGFAHPRKAAALFGHDAALANLRSARNHDRLHHAWLLSGLHGVGKATLAYRFAGELLDDDAARQIAAGVHPNLRSLSRPFNEKTRKFAQAIPVDAVRRIKAFLGATAAQQGYRVVIVDQADDLNIAAANAVLKMLEEPPALTVFFLISSEPGRLLPTIRSRCRALPLRPLGAFDLENAITAAWAASDTEKPDGKALSRIAALSGGSVRRALEISAGPGLALVDQLLSIFASLPSLDYRKVHALADKVTAAGAEQDFELTVTLLLDLLRRFVRHAAERQAGGTRDGGAKDSEIPAFEKPLSRLSDASGLQQWAELWGELAAENRMTAALNLDKRNFLIFCFDRLQATARLTMAQAGVA